jgi:hypothetical protein
MIEISFAWPHLLFWGIYISIISVWLLWAANAAKKTQHGFAGYMFASAEVMLTIVVCGCLFLANTIAYIIWGISG